MKINQLSSFCYGMHRNMSFKSNIAYDDDIMPNSIFAIRDSQKREYALDATPDYYSRLPIIGKPVTDTNLSGLKINSFRSLDNGNYKGGMESAKYYVEQLKNAGIRKFIILCNGEESNVAEYCKTAGMDYTSLYVPIKTTLSEQDKDYILPKISPRAYATTMEDLRQGNVFIGCESGNLRTYRALNVLKILDPQSPLPSNLNTSEHSGNIRFAKWIYENLAEDLKKSLNYTKSFEEILDYIFKYK